MSLNQHHVPATKRYLYGMKGIVVYARSHPSHASCLDEASVSAWPPIKSLFAIGAADGDGDAEFTAFYETVPDQICRQYCGCLTRRQLGTQRVTPWL